MRKMFELFQYFYTMHLLFILSMSTLPDFDPTDLTYEELRGIETRLADPTRISWEELRLYSRIRKKIQSYNIETAYA